MNKNAQYTDATRAGLQCIFGNGFTSPGGPADMTRLLDGLELMGKNVMDLGCGLGGDSLLLGGEFGAARVISVDVDPGNLSVTSENVSAAGLGHVITPTLVEPGPLPFADGLFDVIHSKAMLCHVEDLAPLFKELRRVLKPGGTFVAADWMMGDGQELSQSYHDFVNDLATAGLTFFFRTAAAHEDALVAAGFENAELRDASPIVQGYAEDILKQVMGDARNDLLQALGKVAYEGMVIRSHGRVDALRSGDLQYQYMKAVRTAPL
jgi:SAM-dependent methyltransferase